MSKFVVEYKKIFVNDVTSETRHVKTIIDDVSALQGQSGILGEIAAEPEGLEFLTIRKLPEKKPVPVKKEVK